MIPAKLRRPWFLVPACILSLALGLQLLFFQWLPAWYPGIKDRIISLGWHHFVVMNGAFCILLPLGLLFWAVRAEVEEE